MIAALLIWLVALPPTLALIIYSVEVAFGIFPLRQQSVTAEPPEIAILVPAHDEQLSIAGTVKSLLSNSTQARVVVIADNCTDDTAAVAQTEGAECISRSEPTKRGKGFALAFGRDYLSQAPPDVVLVIDADCRIEPQSIRRLASAAYQLNEPVQARDLLVAPHGAPPLVQISNFAMLIKNLVRARGLYRVGGSIPLFGTGMAFPWSIFATAELANADIVEDLRLALVLAKAGVAVHFVDNALVLSDSAAAEDTVTQRRRWEHGFLITAATHALPTLLRGIRRLSRKEVALGLHLCVPPLSLLLVSAVVSLMLIGVIAVIANVWIPALLLTASLSTAIGLTLLAWRSEGREILPLASLLRAPIYVLRKVPVYAALIASRESTWKRTRRPGEGE